LTRSAASARYALEPLIDETVTVVIPSITELINTGTAEVANPIVVRVELIRVRLLKTVIAGVTDPVAIPIELVRVTHCRTGVTEVTEPVSITVELIWVRHILTVITDVTEPISIAVEWTAEGSDHVDVVRA
jgi:hypothetical protein